MSFEIKCGIPNPEEPFISTLGSFDFLFKFDYLSIIFADDINKKIDFLKTLKEFIDQYYKYNKNILEILHNNNQIEDKDYNEMLKFIENLENINTIFKTILDTLYYVKDGDYVRPEDFNQIYNALLKTSEYVDYLLDNIDRIIDILYKYRDNTYLDYFNGQTFTLMDINYNYQIYTINTQDKEQLKTTLKQILNFIKNNIKIKKYLRSGNILLSDFNNEMLPIINNLCVLMKMLCMFSFLCICTDKIAFIFKESEGNSTLPIMIDLKNNKIITLLFCHYLIPINSHYISVLLDPLYNFTLNYTIDIYGYTDGCDFFFLKLCEDFINKYNIDEINNFLTKFITCKINNLPCCYFIYLCSWYYDIFIKINNKKINYYGRPVFYYPKNVKNTEVILSSNFEKECNCSYFIINKGNFSEKITTSKYSTCNYDLETTPKNCEPHTPYDFLIEEFGWLAFESYFYTIQGHVMFFASNIGNRYIYIHIFRSVISPYDAGTDTWYDVESYKCDLLRQFFLKDFEFYNCTDILKFIFNRLYQLAIYESDYIAKNKECTETYPEIKDWDNYLIEQFREHYRKYGKFIPYTFDLSIAGFTNCCIIIFDKYNKKMSILYLFLSNKKYPNYNYFSCAPNELLFCNFIDTGALYEPDNPNFYDDIWVPAIVPQYLDGFKDISIIILNRKGYINYLERSIDQNIEYEGIVNKLLIENSKILYDLIFNRFIKKVKNKIIVKTPILIPLKIIVGEKKYVHKTTVYFDNINDTCPYYVEGEYFIARFASCYNIYIINDKVYVDFRMDDVVATSSCSLELLESFYKVEKDGNDFIIKFVVFNNECFIKARVKLNNEEQIAEIYFEEINFNPLKEIIKRLGVKFENLNIFSVFAYYYDFSKEKMVILDLLSGTYDENTNQIKIAENEFEYRIPFIVTKVEELPLIST